VEFPLLGQQVSVELANTLFFGGGRTLDGLETADGATRWLAAVDRRTLSDGSTLAHAVNGVPEWAEVVDEGLRCRLEELRGSVRSLFGAIAAGQAAAPEAIEHLNRLSAAAPSRLHATSADGHVEITRRRSPVVGDAVLAALAEDALAVVADPVTAAAMTACPCPGCLGLFIKDDPRRRFCSPTCSTRTRVARHYARNKSR
jgi:predicted RNA-binding Zn ribbon-like protein